MVWQGRHRQSPLLLVVPAKAEIRLLWFVIPAKAGIQGLFQPSRTSLCGDALIRCPSSRRKPGSIVLLLPLVIPAKAGIQGLFTLYRLRVRSNSPAVALQSKGKSKMDPGFRRDDGQRQRAPLLRDVR